MRIEDECERCKVELIIELDELKDVTEKDEKELDKIREEEDNKRIKAKYKYKCPICGKVNYLWYC